MDVKGSGPGVAWALHEVRAQAGRCSPGRCSAPPARRPRYSFCEGSTTPQGAPETIRSPSAIRERACQIVHAGLGFAPDVMVRREHYEFYTL